MKTIFSSVLSLLLLSTVTMANTLGQHQEFCSSDEVRSYAGEEGYCRLILTPRKNAKREGICMGMLLGSIPCVVQYSVAAKGGIMNLTCGYDLNSPIINQDFEASSISYRVAAIVGNGEGKERIITDRFSYTGISARILNVMVRESGSQRFHSVSVHLQSGEAELTELNCQ